MGDISWWGEERPKLHCLDYAMGKYKPVSFETKLKWEITYSDPKQRGFIAKAKLYSNDEKIAWLIVKTICSFGNFCILTSGLPNNFNYRIETNDPENAMYLAEQELILMTTRWRDFYNDLTEIVDLSL